MQEINFLTVDELAKRLKVPKSWVYAFSRQKGNNTIPMKKIGKYNRYILADVMKWIEKQNESVGN